MTQTTSTCILCGATRLQPFFALENAPVEGNLLWPDRQSALNVARGDIFLAFCPRCGHIFNTHFDPKLVAYAAQYENSLYFSPRFQHYAGQLAAGLVNRYNLHDQHLVEIGAGKGDFLHELCRLGQNHASAFDPSYDGAGSPFQQIHFYPEYFTGQNTPEPADFILARHVLEHIPQPASFVQMLSLAARQRSQAAQLPGAPVFIEVPNGAHTLRNLAIWDLIYEHVSYFTAPSLAYLFEHQGFHVRQVHETFEGQFLTLEAETAGSDPPQAPTPAAIDDLLAAANAFASRCREKIDAWQNRLDQFTALGQQAVLWGAGTKGISFLNMLSRTQAISAVVDLNPRKHGKYVTGAGHPIIAPETLIANPPHVVIIMNPIYAAEIRQNLAELQIQAEILTA